MSQAEQIREFVYQNHIEPAREQGIEVITIRAGDIHDEMGLKNKIPAVCGALDTRKLQRQYRVVLENREGPTCGSNVYFTFRLCERFV